MRSSSERQWKILIECLFNSTLPRWTLLQQEKWEQASVAQGSPPLPAGAVFSPRCHSKTLMWTEVSPARNEDGPLSHAKATCIHTHPFGTGGWFRQIGYNSCCQEAYRLTKRQRQSNSCLYPSKKNIMRISSNCGGNWKEIFLVKRTFRGPTYWTT